MKKKISIVFILLATILIFHSCTHRDKPGTYRIDSSIKSKVEKKLKKEGELVLGQMDLRIIENGKEIQNTFEGDKKIPFFTTMNSQGGNALITGHAGIFSGFGFHLIIVGDSYQVYYDI